MNYTVINGDIIVKNIKIFEISQSSTLLVGDTNTVSLSSMFDTPPEELIVGVTVGSVSRE